MVWPYQYQRNAWGYPSFEQSIALIDKNGNIKEVNQRTPGVEERTLFMAGSERSNQTDLSSSGVFSLSFEADIDETDFIGPVYRIAGSSEWKKIPSIDASRVLLKASDCQPKYGHINWKVDEDVFAYIADGTMLNGEVQRRNLPFSSKILTSVPLKFGTVKS